MFYSGADTLLIMLVITTKWLRWLLWEIRMWRTRSPICKSDDEVPRRRRILGDQLSWCWETWGERHDYALQMLKLNWNRCSLYRIKNIISRFSFGCRVKPKGLKTCSMIFFSVVPVRYHRKKGGKKREMFWKIEHPLEWSLHFLKWAPNSWGKYSG